jgi:hypothetical protein
MAWFGRIGPLAVGLAAVAALHNGSPSAFGASAGASRNPAKALKLELTYSERVLVPRGSQIDVRIYDATGKMISTQQIRTKRDAPPYVVDVSIKDEATYPLRVEAHLVSSIGHKFSESIKVSKSDIENGSLVGLWMQQY